jgi:hypothetical protein
MSIVHLPIMSIKMIGVQPEIQTVGDFLLILLKDQNSQARGDRLDTISHP